MRIFRSPNQKQWEEMIQRPNLEDEDLEGLVKEVFSRVGKEGDKAVRIFTEKYDGVVLDNFSVSPLETKDAVNSIPARLREAISLADQNISAFHKSQVLQTKLVETMPGVTCWQEPRPIDPVGIYIPGGSAPLFSTVLMLGIPALLAGCRNIVLCTPPDANNKIAPEILFTAQSIGIEKIFKVGGIQAIAALTLGTENIPRVNKIFGPGNQYVTAAKMYAQRMGTAIDLPAGPSELLIVADGTSNPGYVAADILSQAEHGSDSQVICLVDNERLMNDIMGEIDIQMKLLPRKGIVKEALEHARLIILEGKEEIIELVNRYAPEHLILAVENADDWVVDITNAGSVFIGNYTPESAGDYASGTNHTLPTNGFAAVSGGITVDDFIKKISFQKITMEGIGELGWAIEEMAAAEGLVGHKNAVSIRLKSL